jgi:hypothetical protein
MEVPFSLISLILRDTVFILEISVPAVRGRRAALASSNGTKEAQSIPQLDGTYINEYWSTVISLVALFFNMSMIFLLVQNL